MDSPVATSLNGLANKLHWFRFLGYIDVASFFLWAYDYTLTLDLEVSLIWAAPWSIPKVLFLLTRYLLVINLTAIMYFMFHSGINDKMCLATYQTADWMFVISIGLAETILMIRAWAVWERDRRISIGLSIFFVSVWIAVCVYTSRYLTSLKFTTHVPNPELHGCFEVAGSSVQFAQFALVMGFEGGILILMFIKGYETLREAPNSGLVRLIFVDGILYYIALSALTLINLVVILNVPPDLSNILTVFQGVMHSVLTGRMLLQLRRYDNNIVCAGGVMAFTSTSVPEFMQPDTLVSDHDDAANLG